MNRFDARVRYTRMVIEKCFLELLRDKPVAKITVSELCAMAQINRATFYKHYQDIPQLLEKLEEDLFDQIREMFKDQAKNMERMLLDMMNYTRRLPSPVMLSLALSSCHAALLQPRNSNRLQPSASSFEHP